MCRCERDVQMNRWREREREGEIQDGEIQPHGNGFKKREEKPTLQESATFPSHPPGRLTADNRSTRSFSSLETNAFTSFHRNVLLHPKC